jgi:hypothetical protein
VLATTVAGEAEAIVTGDADLLTLETYSRIRILSPRQFVAGQTWSGRSEGRFDTSVVLGRARDFARPVRDAISWTEVGASGTGDDGAREPSPCAGLVVTSCHTAPLRERLAGLTGPR